MNADDEDPMWLAWQESAPRIYDKTYYSGNPLVARVNDSGHRLVERPYGPGEHFGQVLELGAGTGVHLSHVRHRFDRYTLTDLSPDLLDLAARRFSGRDGLRFETQDATRLNYPDASFDRLVSIYNLEHLPQPHRVLKEWRRVVKSGGVMSIAIPLDGGIAWRLGRYLTTRRSFAREGLDLDYIIAREHINPAYNLIALIRRYFPKRREWWYPFGVHLVDVNLVYCCAVDV
jgi:phosphatidylethanolamine/phosphatidyl-N-methylethanolamine N-methyltransferase